MYVKVLNSIGIAINVAGTLLTLADILFADRKSVGTWGELKHRKEAFSKVSRRTWIGFILIIAGAVIQIICQFI